MRVDRNAADGWSKGVSRSVLYLQGKKRIWMCIFYLIRVPLKFLRTSIRIIIPTIYSQKASQNQLRVRARGGNAVLRDIETYGLRA